MSTGSPQLLSSQPWLGELCFPEGLRWHEGELYFSDVLRDRVLRVGVDARRHRQLGAQLGRLRREGH